MYFFMDQPVRETGISGVISGRKIKSNGHNNYEWLNL